MADLREELESRRFVLEPGLLDRLDGRRRRRQRNRRAATALVAVAIAAGGLFGAVRAFRSSGERPAVTPTPSFVAIAGTYRVTLSDTIPGVKSHALEGQFLLGLGADGKVAVTLPAAFAASA